MYQNVGTRVVADMTLDKNLVKQLLEYEQVGCRLHGDLDLDVIQSKDIVRRYNTWFVQSIDLLVDIDILDLVSFDKLAAVDIHRIGGYLDLYVLVRLLMIVGFVVAYSIVAEQVVVVSVLPVVVAEVVVDALIVDIVLETKSNTKKYIGFNIVRGVVDL